MASSVTAFAVASILFFPIGLLSGYFLHKKSGKMYIVSENSSTGERAQQVANDNDIGPNQELQLDLKDNGPSQPVPVYDTSDLVLVLWIMIGSMKKVLS